MLSGPSKPGKQGWSHPGHGSRRDVARPGPPGLEGEGSHFWGVLGFARVPAFAKQLFRDCFGAAHARVQPLKPPDIGCSSLACSRVLFFPCVASCMFCTLSFAHVATTRRLEAALLYRPGPKPWTWFCIRIWVLTVAPTPHRTRHPPRVVPAGGRAPKLFSCWANTAAGRTGELKACGLRVSCPKITCAVANYTNHVAELPGWP